MILPVTVYGEPLLRKTASPIAKDYPGLQELIDNMYDTMYNADGIGLAAPQVGLSIRLFIVDGTQVADEDKTLTNFKTAFINPEILDITGVPWEMEEGCLSIPNIRENVKRDEQVTIRYFNREWEEKTETYNGMAARVILHEYDHLEGKLFTDYVSPLRKKLLRSKLNAISKGKVNASYRIKVPR